MSKRTIHRSAVTGRFVTKQYTARNPKTTETERRPSGGGKGRKRG